MKLLLAEDDIKLGALVKSLLEFSGFETEWARDGREALERIREAAASSYDVVILDWMLPEISGIEICRLLRNPRKYNYQGIYTKSGVEMNSRTGMLTAGGKELKLSRREFELFRLLFVNSGQIILRETILDKVWTDNPEISPASLDAYIYILRRKIREFSGRIRIRLVKGIGYVLEIEE